MKPGAFKLLLVIFHFGQVSSLLPKANHLVVSGTNHTQVNFEERSFDGVFELVKNSTAFFGAEFNKTVYKRLNDPDDDIHIIVPVQIEEDKLLSYQFLSPVAIKVLERLDLYPGSKRTWVMRRGPKKKVLESKIVWISRLTDPEDKFNPNYPPIEGWTLFVKQESSSVLWNCTDMSLEEAELHKRIRVSAVRSKISSQALLDLYKSESDEVRETFMFCTGKNNERLFLSRQAEDEDPWYCGGRNDCNSGRPVSIKEPNLEQEFVNNDGVGIDESFCVFYVSKSIALRVCETFVVMGVGFLLYIGYDLLIKERKERKESRSRSGIRVTSVEDKVNALIQTMKRGGTVSENAFSVIHETEGGMELLLGCCFDFRRHPIVWHQMAQLIQAEEKKLHRDNCREVSQCVRRKGKSKEATTQFLRSLKPPTFHKICKFHIEEALCWLVDPPDDNKSRRWNRIWAKLKLILIKSLLPIQQTSMYILDFIKDGCLFLFLLKRLQFIFSRAVLLKRLIISHGISIVLSSCVTGWAIQMNNAIINLSSVESQACENLLRVCIFIVTPLIPVAIIYKAVSFSIQKQRLKAKWRRSNDADVSSMWFSLNIIQRKNRKLMVAYSDLKIVEASLEAIPQIYFLVVFSLASWILPETSHLGLTSSPQILFAEAFFLLLSLALSYASVISSILSAMDIRKHDQLTFKNKLLLGLSVTFQIAGRLWPMVVISMLAIVDTPPLSASQASLLLILPVLCHWVCIKTLFKL